MVAFLVVMAGLPNLHLLNWRMTGACQLMRGNLGGFEANAIRAAAGILSV